MVFVFIFYFEMKWYRHNKSHVRKIFVLGMSWLGLEHKLSLQYALIKSWKVVKFTGRNKRNVYLFWELQEKWLREGCFPR